MPWIPEVDRSTAIVDCAVYRDGHREPGEPSWQEAHDDVLRHRSGFVWIGLHEPSERQLAGIASHFALHRLAVEDAVQAHQRPKLEQYDDMLFAVVKTVHYDDSQPHGSAEVVDTGEVMVFLGANYVITVRHGEHGSLRTLRKRLESDTELLALGPSVVLHAILDRTVDGYLAVTSALQEDIDELETSVFARRESCCRQHTDVRHQTRGSGLAALGDAAIGTPSLIGRSAPAPGRRGHP